jgi:hypothetical protein
MVLLAFTLVLTPVAARAGPESLDQLEPGGGEWQVEWLGTFGGDGEQSLEVLAGITDRLVIGGEAEFEGPRDGVRLEGLSAIALYRFADPETRPLGFGVMGEVTIGRDGRLAGLDTRAMVELQAPRWWIQGNAILRHARDAGARGTGFAYAASVQTKAAGTWLGFELSGQASRLAGNDELAPEGRHYGGPSLTFEHDIGEDAEVEIGLAWLARLKGEGPRSGPRVFVQLSF